MNSPSRARPSDRAIAQAFREINDDALENDCQPDQRSYGYRACIDDIRDRARQLDHETPEARAGDCEHSDEWLASELEKLSADMDAGLPSWALLIWSASALRRLTAKATP